MEIAFLVPLEGEGVRKCKMTIALNSFKAPYFSAAVGEISFIGDEFFCLRVCSF